MRENYYRSERKKKQAEKNRLILLGVIAIMVCIGVMAAAIVMYGADEQEAAAGELSSAGALLSASGAGSSEDTVLSETESSEEESSEAASSAPVSSEEASSEEKSSAPVSSAPAASAPVSSAPVSSVTVSSEAVSYVPVSSASSSSGAGSTVYYEQMNNLIAEFDFSKPVTESDAVPLTYFDDAVILGDSRADGLTIYTELKNHVTSYARVSCTAKMVLEGTDSVAPILPKIEKKAGEFKKVYIMLGLNEIGQNYDTIMDRYSTIIDRLKKSQPEAVIYLQTVLPITQYVQNNHDYLRKDKIVSFNNRLQRLAAEKEVYLIDPTPVFMGNNGYMTTDARASAGNETGEIHFNKTYTVKWLDYLRTHTVK